GSPVAFSLLTSVGVAVLPPITEQLSFISSENKDLSNIFVRGESGGVEVSETVVLNGQTEVKTTYIYDAPLIVAKDITLGDVTVKAVTSGTFLQQLLAYETERKHIRLWLQPAPTSQDGTQCLILGKRKIHPITSD